MSDQAEKLQQFIALTGSTEDQAKFFLESAAWQLQNAVDRYFDNESDVVEDAVAAQTSMPQVGSDSKSKPKTKSGNFATFNTLTTSSDEEEEGEAYYAGGSEHSGQQVLGPPKRRDIIDDMFKSVQEHGVEVLDPSSSGSGSKAFKGTGYKLGQSNDDSVKIPGAQEPPPPSEITLRLWQNGFSVNDGDLRPYNDPSNKDFLDSIRKGEIPHELRQGSSEVNVAMEDHRMEVFRRIAKKVVKPFQGQGYTLGSPAPAVLEPSLKDNQLANEAKAKGNLKIDDSKPTTSLLIRLADGSRLVGQFNNDHTIAQVRSFITEARPQYQQQSFNLLSSHPPKVLEDSNTLAEAGVLNAAILQKLV